MMDISPEVAIDPFYVRDLEQMTAATNYVDWQFSLARPFIRGRVLEVGAGIGTFTQRLADVASEVIALEPNAYCFERLSGATAGLSRVRRLRMTVEEYHAQAPARREVDTIVCINVLEHVKDDIGVMREFAEVAAPGGRLVIQVPAMPIAYGEIDRRLGHYRRYTRASLRATLAASGWGDIRVIRYFNTIGLLGWIWNTKVRVKQEQSDAQIRLFDKVLVPLMRRLESLAPVPFGQCLIAVAERR